MIYYFCLNYYISYLYCLCSFPKDTILRDKWIINLNINYIFTPIVHTRICNNHFDDNNFIKTDQLRRLKPDAISTNMMSIRCSLLSCNIKILKKLTQEQTGEK
jgi:hypothetical protein